MNIKKVRAVYFSPTGTTQKIVETIACHLAEQLEAGCEIYDFTLPESRNKVLKFDSGDLAVFGVPVYAGRVPNVLLKYLDAIEGNCALAVPVVLYGNRDYDDALIELRDILERRGLYTIAAAAFIGEHAFSYTLAAGRPDERDLELAGEFAGKVSQKVKQHCPEPGKTGTDWIEASRLSLTGPAGTELSGAGAAKPVPIQVKGVSVPYRGYYQPKDLRGNPVDIRKVKPLTNDDCNDCLICAEVCPMGSISRENVRELIGICIKCGACVKKCPQSAKYFEDEAFLRHKRELEEELTRRAEPEMFL